MRPWLWGLLALFSTSLWAAPVKPGVLTQPGDLDRIIEQRLLRALVVYERGFFFLDRGQQKGILVNQLQGFESWLNRTYLANEKVKLKVIYIPVRQDRLLDYLEEGRGDLVVANMTSTQSRRDRVSFSDPVISATEEWVVSANSLPPFTRITQLSGRRIWVRASSSYFESLQRLNRLLRDLGLPPVYIETVPEYLQDGDLLEMVAAGLIPLTVTDSFKGRPWLDTLPGLRAHRLVPLRDHGHTAWALRPGSPALLNAVNRYLAQAPKRQLYSGPTLRQYLRQGDTLSNILAPERVARLNRIRKVLQKYAERYDLDWLMLAAMAYKESGLDPSARSPGGAIGLLQLLPSTGQTVNITGARLASLEGNVEAACRYLRLILDTYFNDPKLDRLNRHLMVFAAYNAGPNRILRLRQQAARSGVDPQQWFGNLDQLVANEVGQIPINYVGTIYKYYMAYRFSLQQIEGKQKVLRRQAAQ